MKKIRTPVQRRSQKTKELIIENGKELFYKKGFNGTSSNEIAKKAGLSIGSFYSYFKDKKALFIEILIRHKNETIQTVIEEFTQNSITKNKGRKLINEFIKNIVAAHDFSAEFHREAAVLRYSDSEIERIYKDEELHALHEVENFLKAIHEQLRVTDTATAARVILTIIEDFAHWIKFSKDISEHDEEMYINEVTDMIARYLFK